MTGTRLFRWVGSKQHLVPRLVPMIRGQLAAGGGRLVSLFYGSGALEQAAAPGESQVAAEANADLLCVYEQVARDPEKLFHALEQLEASVGRSRAAFLAVRTLDPEDLASTARAARFLWLSAMSFNGLWRVNRAGRHNVPADPARLQKPWPFATREALMAASASIQRVRFRTDWREAAESARPGDVIISDPPYVGGFDAYTAQRFGTAEHHALSTVLADLVRKGCAVIAFNSPQARPLYAYWARVQDTTRSGRISSDGSGRQRVRELIAFAGLRSFRRAA